MSLSTVLEQLDVSMDQFIDFCIMCGCDYLDTIRGIGEGKVFLVTRKPDTIFYVRKHWGI